MLDYIISGQTATWRVKTDRFKQKQITINKNKKQDKKLNHDN